MAYFAPYVDETGYHFPTYQDIEDLLVQQARTIFGADIYLGNDSQDFQDIAARAQTIYDSFLASQATYNSFSPVTAVGTGLDSIVALNGVVREGETNSTAPVDLTGQPFTVITNGVVGDDNGNLWDLPASITLDEYGEFSTTATAQEPGAVTALIGQINTIITPTSGWSTVTNTLAATAGRGVETDAELRARQALSVANPSQALTTGILGGVLEVDDVASAQLYENDTSSPVSYINGVENPSDYPAHSITLVVDGGTDEDIASAIARRKTPGCYTDGDVSVVVYDRFGVPTTIRFYRPDSVGIAVAVHVTPLTGYSIAVGDAGKQAIVDYINSLVAGQPVILSQLWQAALTANTGSFPYFSLAYLEAARTGDSLGFDDIILYFDEMATCQLSDVEWIAV